MPDLIGHPGVHVGAREWPHEGMGCVDPRLRGGDEGEAGVTKERL